MTDVKIESAWGKYPDYRIDLVPYEGTARVYAGDLLVAESRSAVRLLETKHVERLYFPEADVHWEHFEPTEHLTICPFKGQASYWSLVAGDQPEENVVWTYRQPFDEVAGIEGYVCFYQERLHHVLEEHWPGLDDEHDGVRNRFPLWGDASDLLGLMNVTENGPHRFEGPTYHDLTRNVVEGGQLLGEAIVAASKTIPDQRVTSAFMTFPKSARFDLVQDLDVEVLRQGRTFSTVEVRVSQEGVLCSPALLLMDSGAGDTISGTAPMPDVPGPYEAVPYDGFGVSGRDVRIVDAGYDRDPDRVGPPDIYAWIRFRDNPAEVYLRQALVAQAATHWTIGAALRPHPGISELAAHVTLSTGIMSIAIAFHDDAPVTEWFLYSNPAIWSGRGLAQGEGRIYTQDGRLLASYSVQAMIRGFTKAPEAMGMDWSNAM